MIIVAKDDWIHIRVDSELKSKIQRVADENGYADISKFIIDVLIGRVDETKWNKSIREELMKILEENPDILNVAFRNIHIIANDK